MPSNRSDHTTKTTSTTLSKRTPLTAIRDNLTKKFSLKKKQQQTASATTQQKQPLRARRYANPSLSKDQQYRYAVGWSNVFYECEDRLCNKYFLNDASGDKQSKKPKSVTIIDLPQDMIDRRTEYLQTARPPIDRSCETIQLLILAENESIQRVKLEAAGLGGKQLESEEIHSIQDVLALLNMSHHQQAFSREGIDLSTAFFLKDEDLEELGLKTGERIRLQIVLDFMRQVKVQVAVTAANTQVMRTTRFIKGDIVEHLKESENLIRRGKVVGVHADDLASGVYYTVALENENGYELQSAERKLEFPGIWETTLRAQGIEPIFKEPGFEEEEEKAPSAPVALVVAATNDNDTLAKYTRMKRAGLPDSAIMDAMRRDGVQAPPGFFSNDDDAPPPPPVEREEFSFIVEEEEITIVEELDTDQQRARRKSSATSGILAPPPPLPHQESMPYRANAVSLSELEILKAIDEQLTLETSQDISLSSSPLDNSNFAKLRRMSSSTTSGLPPPPPVPQYSADYFDGMRIASLEPTIEEEDFEFSGMTSPPPPIPGEEAPSFGMASVAANHNSMELSGMSAPPPPPPSSMQQQQQQEAKWEEDISFLHNLNDMDTMHEEPFEFEDVDYTIT